MADASTKRFLSLLLAPLFLVLQTKLGLEVPESVQDLLIVSIITYVGGSHFKEALLKKAALAGTTAAESVTTKEQAAEVFAKPEVKP
jgi:hypothetical protein